MNDPSSDPLSEAKPGFLERLKARVLPTMPDFYALLVRQCKVTTEGTASLVEFLRGGDLGAGQKVHRLEHDGDRIKARSLEILHRSFATPMDREDFYDAIVAVDNILNYAKTSVKEVEILGIVPDRAMAEMARLVDTGARSLLSGFEQLEHDPDAADRCGNDARKSERRVEDVYRGALASLFDPLRQLEYLQSLEIPAGSVAELDRRSGEMLTIVTQMMKRREIYRHLSNAADQVAHAAELLENIVAKAT